MPTPFGKKNKIVLSDYNYRRDIENRLLVAKLTEFELDVLKEILNGSLKISLRQLAEILAAEEEHIREFLDKFEPTKLVRRIGDSLEVNKEIRKNYESLIAKFSNDFSPGLDFLQNLLSKVPIHVIPNWYNITKLTENIFHAIIEKFFATPKTYERYLMELSLDDAILENLVSDVFNSPDYMVESSQLITRYGLTHDKFEEYMLNLEFNFICYICYRRINNKWVEVVQPLHEWTQYLEYLNKKRPKGISSNLVIKPQQDDFAYVKDMTKLICQMPLPIHALPVILNLTNPDDSYLEDLIAYLIGLKLATLEDGCLHSTPDGCQWSKQIISSQAISLYRNPITRRRAPESLSDKDIREIEKGIRTISRAGWIKLEDFQNYLVAPLGGLEPVALKNKGKKWWYELPRYTKHEHNIIEGVIYGPLLASGMVAAGDYFGEKCFCVTPFGRMMLDDDDS